MGDCDPDGSGKFRCGVIGAHHQELRRPKCAARIIDFGVGGLIEPGMVNAFHHSGHLLPLLELRVFAENAETFSQGRLARPQQAGGNVVYQCRIARVFHVIIAEPAAFQQMHA